MKIFLISILKLGLAIIYAPLKLFRTKNQIVYLSRQSNDKSIDMLLLEQAIRNEDSSVKQVFRLKMIDEGIVAKIKYCFSVIGDMYYLATSKVAILDTYSITVSCLKHKKDLKVIQMWHALGAIKKFGLQSVGTKDGRDESISNAMNMHKNYDYVLAPSPATALFYMEAFGVDNSRIKICPMPRVDAITDGNAKVNEFYSLNPGLSHKKIVLYLPTFRDREAYIANMLKTEMKDKQDLALLISPHPLSKVDADSEYSPNGNFSSMDLMKLADVVITDYSACAFEAALLMKKLYFFVPDYKQYEQERGLNINLFDEMAGATFEEAQPMVESIINDDYDMNQLYSFKEKYVANNANNSEVLAKFILMLIK